MVLRLISCSPRRPGLFATVIGGVASANLMPASGHQDHTTSPSASRAIRQRRISVHRIPPRVRDDREPPLQRNGTAGVVKVIWVRRELKYFCEQGWTGQPLICPSGRLHNPSGRQCDLSAVARRAKAERKLRHRLEAERGSS